MRPSAIGLLVRFHLLFISRRVVARGVMRSRSVRWTVAGISVAAFIGYVLLSITVIRQLFTDTSLLLPLLELVGVSSAFWVVAFYTVVKVLFLKADALTEITFTLPVTNRERAVALLLFEMLLEGAGAVWALGAFCIASALTVGPSALPTIVFGVAVPVVLGYLCLAAIQMLLERALARAGMHRSRGLVIPLMLGGLLVTTFWLTNEQASSYIGALLSEETAPWAPQLVILRVGETSGWATAIVLSAALAVVATALLLAASPREYVPLKRFFRVLPGFFASSRFGALILLLVRSFESQFVFAVAVIAAVALPWMGWDVPPLHLMLSSFLGLYAYASSEPLRRITVHRQRPLVVYVQLIGAQTVVLAGTTILLGPLHVVGRGAVAEALLVAAFGVATLIITTLVGIAFPPERGNPFSVAIGALLMVLVSAVLALGINAFNFPLAVNALIITVLVALAVFYSVLGITRIEEGARHAVVYPIRHRSHHRRPDHRDRRGSRVHRHNVQHATG